MTRSRLFSSASALLALSLWLLPESTQAQTPSASELEDPSQFSLKSSYCEAPLLITDVLKDLAHAVQTEGTEMTSPFFDDSEEVTYGDSVLTMLPNELVMVDDAKMEGYLDALLADLTASTGRGLKWSVRIYDAPDPNAYALPGGTIIVSTGLLDLITNEAQIFSVLAHEVGHHELRHVAAHLQYLKLLGLWTPAAADTDVLASNTLGLLTLPTRSRQERDADSYALEAAYRLGYSPYQMVQLMNVFDFYYQGLPNDEGNSFGTFLAQETRNLVEDHPRPRMRACALKQQIKLRQGGDEPKFYLGTKNFETRTPRSKKEF